MADSPAPSNADDQKPAQEQITFRFCRECSNMLYPKEDRNSNTLMFSCRTCTFSEPAASSCVFRNNLYNTVGETAGVTQDVGSDPTVGTPNPDDDSDFYICTLCGEEVSCAFCGESISKHISLSQPGEEEEEEETMTKSSETKEDGS